MPRSAPCRQDPHDDWPLDVYGSRALTSRFAGGHDRLIRESGILDEQQGAMRYGSSGFDP